MSVDYDENYTDGIAEINPDTGSIKIGPKWFGSTGMPPEATSVDRAFLKTLSSHQREMFVFRHELAHMEKLNLKMVDGWTGRIPERASRPWEIDANERAMKWARETYENK